MKPNRLVALALVWGRRSRTQQCSRKGKKINFSQYEMKKRPRYYILTPKRLSFLALVIVVFNVLASGKNLT